jgi:septum formation protein
LKQLGLPCRVIKSRVKEDHPKEDPLEAVGLLAARKASAVHELRNPAWVLGADTVVVLESEVLGKPQSRYDAERMLLRLNGREHSVITGFCILNPSGQPAHSQSVISRVLFKPLSKKEISAYIGSGEPFGKAGGYAIQGIGAFMVEAITGSYTNVVGLPLCELIESLLNVGALERFPLPFEKH